MDGTHDFATLFPSWEMPDELPLWRLYAAEIRPDVINVHGIEYSLRQRPLEAITPSLTGWLPGFIVRVCGGME